MHPAARRPILSTLAALTLLLTSASACEPRPVQAAQAALPADASSPALLSVKKIPAWTNDGDAREHAVLVDEPRVKIVALALRRGAALPVHSVERPVTIQVVRGRGELRVGDTATRVEPGAVALFLLIAAVLAFAALEGLGWVVAGFLDD